MIENYRTALATKSRRLAPDAGSGLTETYTAETFWPAFSQDLGRARGRVLVQSPFISGRRIRTISETIVKLMKFGVTICTFVQEPRHWHDEQKLLEPQTAQQLEEIKAAIKSLEVLGVHVNLRRNIHEKVAIIDQNVLWEGSLNILSHANTKERMRRWTDRTEVLAAIAQHSLEQCSVCRDNLLEYGIEVGQFWSPQSMATALSKRLAAQRILLSLSQYELARLCGLTQGRISQMEAGDTNIPFNTLTAIARKLELVPMMVPDFLVPSVGRLLRSVDE